MTMGTLSIRYRRAGFTIVELLIVIVIIGILAAITIVAYNGIQNRARTAAVTSSLAGAAKQLELSKVDAGVYPSSGASLKKADDVDFQYSYVASSDSYCLTATKDTISYKITSTAQTPIQGGCAGHSQGGVAAITNMATNPSAENNTAGITTVSATGTRDTSWYSSGTASFMITPSGATNDTYIAYGGDLGGFRMGLQAGKTYTISGTIRLTAAQAGSLSGNGSRQITAWYTSSTGSHSLTRGTQAANTTGQSRVSVTYSIPATATAAWIRLYNGASLGNGVVWWDDIMITEGATNYSYADGDSSNWIWNSAEGNSTSTGPPQ